MKLILGGQRWTLEIVAADDDRLQGNVGWTDRHDQCIYLAETGGAGSRLETLCHEIQHAIDSAYTLPYDPVTEIIRPGTPEEDVALVSGKGWAEVFIRNPRLVTLLRQLAKDAR